MKVIFDRCIFYIGIMLMLFFKFIKENPEVVLPLLATCFSTAMLFQNLADQYWWYESVMLSGWITLMGIWTIIARRKMKTRRLEAEARQWDFIEKYLNANLAKIKFFVPSKSDHTTVNWWRKLHNKHVLTLYEAAYSEDNEVQSYIKYLFTERELFEAKLKGYFDTNDREIAKKAMVDPWLRAKLIV